MVVLCLFTVYYSLGGAVLVCFVLTAVPIYLLVAIKVTKWFIRAIDKVRRSFYGKQGRKLMGPVV